MFEARPHVKHTLAAERDYQGARYTVPLVGGQLTQYPLVVNYTVPLGSQLTQYPLAVNYTAPVRSQLYSAYQCLPVN